VINFYPPPYHFNMLKKSGLAVFCLALCLALSNNIKGQVNIPAMGINYSALLRDASGNVLSSRGVQLRFTLLAGQTGTPANSPWIEIQKPVTDKYGFANVVIGMGTKAGGSAASFANVDFSQANYWLLAELYNGATSTYIPLSKQALQAVPYAKLALYSATTQQSIPAGSMFAFGGDTNHVPQGWLLCDGRQLDKTNPAYQALFNAIQYNWGSVNGNSNLFKLPDTRGVFLRGANNGNGADPDVIARYSYTGGNTGDKVGSFQQSAIQGHTHQVTDDDVNTPGSDFVPNSGHGQFPDKTIFDTTYGYVKSPLAIANPRISRESRPANVYVTFIIKL
jgi:microcystin-dependent protein